MSPVCTIRSAPSRIRLLDDLAHFSLGHVDAGVHVGEVRNAQAVQGEREIGKDQRAPRDRRQSFGAPDAVCGKPHPNRAVCVRRTGEGTGDAREVRGAR